jgi:mannose-1-phosphate guanylyltransferase
MAALQAFDPDAVVAVLPSDHVVEKQSAFRNVLIAATAAAEAGWLVTLGIAPQRADTGFGYIEAHEPLEIKAPVPVLKVKRFIEKPKPDAAERMVAAGGHYWNAGMFVWRVDKILEAYREHLPKTAQALDALADAIGSPRYESVLAEVWEETDRTTIDYGIAERAKNVAVVPADIGWHDVGNWSRLADIAGAGPRAADDHVAVDSSGNYIYAPGKTTVTIGVNDLIVVETDDVLLIAAKDRAEEVKAVVDRLAREEKEHLL